MNLVAYIRLLNLYFNKLLITVTPTLILGSEFIDVLTIGKNLNKIPSLINFSYFFRAYCSVMLIKLNKKSLNALASSQKQ